MATSSGSWSFCAPEAFEAGGRSAGGGEFWPQPTMTAMAANTAVATNICASGEVFIASLAALQKKESWFGNRSGAKAAARTTGGSDCGTAAPAWDAWDDPSDN